MAAMATVGTLVSCVGCQATIEYLHWEVANSLNLATFVSFIFVSIVGLFTHTKFLTAPRFIPTSACLRVVAIYFLVYATNNYAMRFHIYFPLYIIFKSGGLLSSMMLCYLLRGHRYTFRQMVSVFAVTAGIVIFSLASLERDYKGAHDTTPAWAKALPFPPFFIGIFLLSVAVVMGAYLGITQEDIYIAYGRHDKELMFYAHFLALPAFALLGDELVTAASDAWSTPNLQLAGWQLPIPTAWAHILLFSMLQLLCVQSVFRLSAMTSSLNVTMVTSLRKFLSFFISFCWFANPCTVFHIIGAFFVFVGTFTYSGDLFREPK